MSNKNLSSGQNLNRSDSSLVMALALYDYQAADDNQISLKENSTITILKKDDSGWWQGYIDPNSVGWFPASYVKEISMKPNTTRGSAPMLSQNTTPKDSLPQTNQQSNHQVNRNQNAPQPMSAIVPTQQSNRPGPARPMNLDPQQLPFNRNNTRDFSVQSNEVLATNSMRPLTGQGRPIQSAATQQFANRPNSVAVSIYPQMNYTNQNYESNLPQRIIPGTIYDEAVLKHEEPQSPPVKTTQQILRQYQPQYPMPPQRNQSQPQSPVSNNNRNSSIAPSTRTGSIESSQPFSSRPVSVYPGATKPFQPDNRGVATMPTAVFRQKPEINNIDPNSVSRQMSTLPADFMQSLKFRNENQGNDTMSAQSSERQTNRDYDHSDDEEEYDENEVRQLRQTFLVDDEDIGRTTLSKWEEEDKRKTQVSLDSQLPPNWERISTMDGVEYYCNVATNQTCWSPEEILNPQNDKFEIMFNDSLSKILGSVEAIQYVGPMNVYSTEVTWDSLTKAMIHSVMAVDSAIKYDKKELYRVLSERIILCAKMLMMASNTTEKGSQVLRQDQKLRSVHSKMIDSLQAFIVSVKKSEQVWPPPDSVFQLRETLAQILLQSKNFIAVARTVMRNLDPLPGQFFETYRILVEDPPIDFGSRFLDRYHPIHVDMQKKTGPIMIRFLDQFETDVIHEIEVMFIAQGEVSYENLLADGIMNIVAHVGNMLAFIDEWGLEDTLENYSQDPQVSMALEAHRNNKINLQYVLEYLNMNFCADDELFMSRSIQKDEVQREVTRLLRLFNAVKISTKKLHHFKEKIDIFNQEKKHIKLSHSEEDANPKSIPAKLMRSGDLSRAASGSVSRENPEKLFDNMNFNENKLQQKDRDIMGPDYIPEDLQRFGKKDRRVKAGTVEALVAHCTSHEHYESGFVKVFLLTFRLFTTPEAFVKLLVERFLIQPPPNISRAEKEEWTKSKQTRIQIHVCNVVIEWLENFWYSATDMKALSDIENFAKLYVQGTVWQQKAGRIRDFCTQRASRNDKRAQNMSLNFKPLLKVGTNAMTGAKNLKLLDIEPKYLAEQLTLGEAYIFRNIHPIDLLFYKSEKKKEKQAGDKKSDDRKQRRISDMINHSNHITGWVAESIVTEKNLKQRSKILRHFIYIAHECHRLKNYATREAIIAALNSTPIYRLKKTWELLKPQTKQIFDALSAAMNRSNNFSIYRKQLKESMPPCIPFLGLILTDITFVKQGNPDTLQNGRLVNYDKFIRLAQIVESFDQLQSEPYSIALNEVVQGYIAENVKENSGVGDLQQLSMALEPPQNTK